jgi:hypothetical protein
VERTPLIAIVVGIAAAAAVCAAGVFLFIGSEGSDAEMFTVTYYKDGNKISEKTVSFGSFVVVADDIEERSGSDRFIGWNTKPDLTGSIIQSGTLIKVERNISLYAMTASYDVFAILLPEKQEGYTITAEPLLVISGRDAVITFTLLPSHVAEELVIAVNGNPMKMDAMGKIYLKEVAEDKVVTVAGVYDKREHSISLPDPQIGYVLTSSEEKVHHGQPYTLEYKLLTGYKQTNEFGIHVNGGEAKFPAGGTLIIEDVRDNHVITVTGVEPIIYNITIGKNIAAYVKGVPSATATVEDYITIQPADGYSLPSTFNAQISGQFKVESKGYRVTSDIVFPSVLRITAGDNIKMNGGTAKTVYVCPDDKITITASSGYALPDDFNDKTKTLSGSRYSSGGFYFTNDATIPSIYKVVFNGHNKVHATFYVVGGTALPSVSNPERVAYYFSGWDVSASSTVINDLTINSVWSPMTFDVYFGPNLEVKIGSKNYLFEGESTDPPQPIKVKADEKVVIKNRFSLEMPSCYGPSSGKVTFKDGSYDIIENCSFPGITYVQYWESDEMTVPTQSVIIGSVFTTLSEPTESREGFVFTGWMSSGKPVGQQFIVENKGYVLYASWRPADS